MKHLQQLKLMIYLNRDIILEGDPNKSPFSVFLMVGFYGRYFKR